LERTLICRCLILFQNFSFFDLLALTFNPRAKFELCILSRSRDIRGIPKFKSRSRDLGHAPFLTYFSFSGLVSVLVSVMINLLAKFEVCIFSHSRDIRGSRNFKSRSRDHGHAPFWPIFHFFCLVSLTINVHAKFEVCIFSRSRDITGSRNFKSRSRDLGHAPF